MTQFVTETDSQKEDVFVFPASFAQQRLWLIDQFEPGRPTYNIAYNVKLHGLLDVGALANALTYIVERHEALRTVFDTQDGQPVQVILPPYAVSVPVIDLSALSAEERGSALERCVITEGNRPFDLRTGPVFRSTIVVLGPEEHALLITVHHIAADGWSLGVLQRELATAYDALAQGAAPQLAELPIQYADFALWQRDQLQGPEVDVQLAYWTKQLESPLIPLELPTDRPRTAAGERTAGHVSVHVPKDVADAVQALSRDASVTPFTTLLAAYQVLLYRYGGEEDVVVGSPIAGRTRAETQELIGFFVNTLALRTNFAGGPTFREALGRTRTTVLGALAHQDLPFEKLVEVLQPKRDRTRNPIFQTFFSLQDGISTGPLSLRELAVTKISGSGETAKFDIQLLMHTSADGFRGTLEYDSDLFDPETMARFARHFTMLLRSAITDPDRTIDTLSLVDADERRLVITTWNDTAVPYPPDATIASLFAAQAAATPTSVAVQFGNETLTYAELDARVTTLARYLQGRGVGAGKTVGVCLDRSLELIVALFAVLKAGAAYVPLDPDYPAERLAFMAEDAGFDVLLTQDRLATLLPSNTSAIVRIDSEWNAIVRDAGALRLAELAPPAADDLAYIIYTSGSTGKPKGACNTHRAVVNQLLWLRDQYHITASDVVLQKTPVSFDVSVWELFTPLIAGARLVLAIPGGHKDPTYLRDVIMTQKVTLAHFVPSMLRPFLDDPSTRDCTSLRDVLCSGEALPYDLQSKFFSVFPSVGLHNLYGPTEAAVHVTAWTCVHEDTRQLVPIGRPVANTQLYVLDSTLQPVPVGVPGELYLGGVQVCAGYHRRPDLTAERFIPDPFTQTPGARLYKTGDRARWLRDGTIDYLGRLDGQIKLRGFRIELGEIEAALSTHPRVRECAVVVRDDAQGIAMLVAYYTLAPAENAGDDSVTPIPVAELRADLRRTLPDHMVPSVFVLLEAMPLSPSGKLDRRALPSPEAFAGNDARGALVKPRTTLEHELLHIWEMLLPKLPISIYDDFFEIGGHSLLAVQMLAEVERLRGRRLPLATLFEGATIYRLASILENAVFDAGEPGVVVLQSNGTQRPFIFLHGDVRGGGWYCRRLAPLVSSDIPMYVLPTLHTDAPDEAVTIESMAKSHIESIRRIQPTGPYRLGGFCVGGLVAFEIARQLEAAGELVDRLIVIDTAATNVRYRYVAPIVSLLLGGKTQEQRLDQRAKWMQRLHYFYSRLRSVRRMNVADQARWFKTNLTRHMFAPFQGDPEVEDLDDAPADFNARPATGVLKSQSRAAAVYMPRRYRGRVDTIWATDDYPNAARFSLRGWDRVAPDIRFHGVISPHVGLITYNITALADAIRVCLEPDDA